MKVKLDLIIRLTKFTILFQVFDSQLGFETTKSILNEL